VTIPEGDAETDAHRVFDIHTHAFPDPVAARAIPKLEAGGLWLQAKAWFDGTIRGLVASMDRAGIRRAAVHSVATRPEQVTKITDWSISIASDLPAGQAGRIVPFASIHPDYPDPEGEVARIAAAGLRGLKFHPQYAECPLDDPRVIRIARAAAGAGLAMLFHSGYDLAYEKDDLASPRRLRRLHEAVPDLRMVAAHLGGWECWEEVLREVVGLPIYLETSYSLGRIPPRLLDAILERHPHDYLLFGTDAPWTDQKEELAKFMALPLPADHIRRMLWENPCRVIGEKP
jgi:uncharacterized protein